MLNKDVFWRVMFLSLAAAVSGCAQDVQPIDCRDPNFQCYIDQAIRGIKEVRQNISYWSNVNLFAQVFIALSGIVATVMIALQGDKNKRWTRPIGLVATALVTGLTSALVSFHVPENIDKLVDITGRMTHIVNEFNYDADELKAGRSPEEIDDAYRKDPVYRKKVNNLTTRFCNDYNKIKIDMLKLSGSAAKLNSISDASRGSALQPIANKEPGKTKHGGE